MGLQLNRYPTPLPCYGILTHNLCSATGSASTRDLFRTSPATELLSGSSIHSIFRRCATDELHFRSTDVHGLSRCPAWCIPGDVWDSASGDLCIASTSS